MKAAIYTRVSTVRQNTDRQVAELQEYVTRQGFEVVLFISEVVTGSS
jgi:DNA invertase Pin-like site-specific DNA recombinase